MHKARQAIASSYAKRIRQVVEEEEQNPGYLEKLKTLPHSKEATNVTALLFTKVLLTGMNHALGQKKKGHKFADGGDGEAADIRDVEVLPFQEAVEYMQGRLPLDAKEYYKLADKARFRAFTVSLLADGDLLKKAKDMLAKNLEEGGGLKDFLVKTDTDLLAGVGMAGKGGGWYWETVYRTNVQTAYNVGRAIGFETVPPVALELVGIGDTRQTELCKSLTQPPVRRLYGDEFWKKFWPPLHFNCRTTVRAIYDPQELEEQPITGIPTDAEEHKSQGWGSYPLDNDRWWEELPSMKKRAQAYGVQGMIDRARKALFSEKSEEILDKQKLVDPSLLNSVTNRLKEQGITVWMDDEADKFLNRGGAEATIMYPDIVIFHSKLSASGMYEELIHLAQIRKLGREPTATEIAQMEIEAKEKLLRNSKAYGITEYEQEIVKDSIVYYTKLLDESGVQDGRV